MLVWSNITPDADKGTLPAIGAFVIVAVVLCTAALRGHFTDRLGDRHDA
jgi:hypothetical protein